MNPFDILTVLLASYFILRGIFRGLVREMAAIVGVLGGFYLAYTFYPPISIFISHWLHLTQYIHLLSFMIIFCTAFTAVSFAGAALKHLLKVVHISWLDRVWGALLGAVKTILFASVVLMALTAFLPKEAPIVRHSLLAPYVLVLSEQLAKLVPKDMKKSFKDKVYDIKKTWKI
jgi:membrane protein required for colicin V production